MIKEAEIYTTDFYLGLKFCREISNNFIHQISLKNGIVNSGKNYSCKDTYNP